MKLLKIGGLALGLAMTGLAAHASEVGKAARDYTITTLDKQTVSSAELKGKVVVLNYWATWCTPCKAEMVVFENYLRTHPGTDLKIYAVTTETVYSNDKLKPLQGILHFPLATKLWARGAYGVKTGVPTSYVIDRSGVIRHAEAGAFDETSFDALVTPLLAQQVSPVTAAR
jgi:cytochrome c biogenesis protein CcmG/thiol:disulfide interchange protein DsbE